MRAVIIATNSQAETDREQGTPQLSPLFPFLNRPFIEHVLGRLVTLGTKDVHVIAGDDCGAIQQTLGPGERWGCSIRYHRLSKLCSPFDHVAETFGSQSEPLLLVSASKLLDINIAQLEAQANSFRPLLFVEEPRSSTDVAVSKWTGWAFLPSNTISSVPLGQESWE